MSKKIRAKNIPGRARGEEFECSDDAAQVYSSSGMGEPVGTVHRAMESPVNRMLDTGGDSPTPKKKRKRLVENR